jgi:DNA-binding LacI/PurR family transcriptional regulator
MAGGRVTIKDVAREAGVSPTTVSHALSGLGRVNPETQARVRDTVRTLGYRANPLARNLRHDRFGAVGLYLPERSLSLQFYIDLALAASRSAFAHECGLTLLPPVVDPEDILRLPLDGVIVAEPVVDDPVVTAFTASALPVVLCEAADDAWDGAVSFVDNQHDLVVAELLDHLVDQGAHEIAVVGAHESVWWSRLVRRACEDWASRTGHPLRWSSIPFACDLPEAREAVDAVLDEAVPEALVIAQQGLASAALASAAARGLSVPGDLLVACGVDGPDLATSTPPVTAIDLLPTQCGELAAQLLLGGIPGQVAHLRPVLRVRESTQRG